MKKNVILDHTNKRIMMSKDFARKSSNAESEEYRLLQSIKADYPEYKTSIGVIKKKENKESYRGLTYAYMERYIFIHGTKEDNDEYKNLRFLSECHSVRYPVIKQWFLTKYPDVVRYGAKEEFVSHVTNAA